MPAMAIKSTSGNMNVHWTNDGQDHSNRTGEDSDVAGGILLYGSGLVRGKHPLYWQQFHLWRRGSRRGRIRRDGEGRGGNRHGQRQNDGDADGRGRRQELGLSSGPARYRCRAESEEVGLGGAGGFQVGSNAYR